MSCGSTSIRATSPWSRTRTWSQPSAQRMRGLPRLLLLRLGICGRAGQHRDRAAAELVQRELEEEGRVDAARVRHQHRAELAHDATRAVELAGIETVELDHLQLEVSWPRRLRKAPSRARRTRPRSRSAT